MPVWRDVALGLWQRAWIFLRRAGTIILVSTVVLWILLSYPKPPADADRPALDYSVAGVVSHHLEPIFRPVGFNQEITLALIPAMAAREVAVSALGTVYALQGDEEEVSLSLVERLQGRSEEHTSELQSLMRISYAVFCLKTKNKQKKHITY